MEESPNDLVRIANIESCESLKKKLGNYQDTVLVRKSNVSS